MNQEKLQTKIKFLHETFGIKYSSLSKLLSVNDSTLRKFANGNRKVSENLFKTIHENYNRIFEPLENIIEREGVNK